jgi:hypothetical protein
MRAFTAVLVLASAFAALANEVTPVEKVITLMEDLKAEVEHEGETEAATYDTFSCFCKSMTEEKASAIKEEQDNIEGFAATLQEQTSISNAKAHEVKELDTLIATLDKDMAKIESMREKEKTKYESQAADIQKGIDGLEGAIADMKAGMPSSLAQVKTSVRKSLLMADTLDMDPKHSRTIASLLQEDESEAPSGDGEFHSGDIVATLEKLQKDFKGRKTQLDQIEGQNEKDFTETMKSKSSEKKTAQDAKTTAESDKSNADANVATASDDTVLEEATLKDDELYMKDLTERCELKAREWDQRSQMRAGEVTALGKAIDIIKNRAKDNESANKRALIQTATVVPERKSDARDDVEDSDIGDMSFLQVSSPRKQLRGIAAIQSSTAQARREKAIANLVAKAEKLKSPVLATLAMKIGADPFAKVRRLVQELIERLVKEAAAESSKKGWCDTSMGKANHNRDSNMDAVMTINGEVMALEAKKATLEEEIATLTQEISDLNDSLAKQTKLRTEEKAENMDTLDKAKAGLAAVKDAYDVLQTFYKNAAKGKVSLVQASPVDEDAPGVHGGAYKGGQAKAGGIFAMLDVIVSDFERSIRVTTEAEKEAHASFVEFERTTKSSIMSKETGKSQAELDLKETDQKIAEGMEDLNMHQKMLDDALKELEDLRPACVDTGMSYADKVAKREEEIDALKKAMCELDGEGVEADCPP